MDGPFGARGVDKDCRCGAVAVVCPRIAVFCGSRLRTAEILIARSQADGQGVAAAAAAALAAQLCFEVGEAHRARLAAGQAGILDHRAVPAAIASRLDDMPGPQILQPKGVPRWHPAHHRSPMFAFGSG